jgi:hypothetical protein
MRNQAQNTCVPLSNLQQDLTIRAFAAAGSSHALPKPCNKLSKLLLLQHELHQARAANTLMQASASQT